MKTQGFWARARALLVVAAFVGCNSPKPESASPATPEVRAARVATLATEEACGPGDTAPRPTVLVYEGGTSAEYGDVLALVARLTDEAGQPLATREVRFTLGTLEATAITDELGMARAPLVLSLAPAAVPLQVGFAGDTTHAPASTTATVTISRADTVTRVLGPTLLATGTPQQVRASLADADEQEAIAGRVLVFEAGGARATATTDAAGVATATLSWGTNATGPAVLAVSFAGDTYYEPSRDSAPVTRYLPTAFSVWGGNTPGLQLGQRVNFWGHSWAKQVTGGAYDAQADMKGWAPGLKAFALCQPTARPGGTPPLTQACWNSKTGNSFPPASLPEYIGVIVPDAIAKQQGTVYGNVAALAVVKVDPEPPYGPVPGKPGWGTLVALVDGGSVFPRPVALVASQRQPLSVRPGQSFDVTVDIGNPSATAARAVVITERFENVTPTTGEQAPGTIEPSAQRSVSFTVTAPSVAPRGGDESQAAYLARLAALDATPLRSVGRVRYEDPAGGTPAPIDLSSITRLQVPRLAVTLSAPSCAGPCTTLRYVLSVANLGSGKAQGVTATVVLPDGTRQTLELGTLAANLLATRTVEWTVPEVAPRAGDESVEAYLTRLQEAASRTHDASVELTWADDRSNAYGPIGAASTTEARLPILTATAERPGPVLPGQTLPLSFTVTNLGTVRAVDARLQVEGGSTQLPPFSLEGGQSGTFAVDVVTPQVAARGVEETDAAYLERLQAVDGSLVSVGYSLDWASACESRFGPLPGLVKTFTVLPVVTLGLEGPATADAGETLRYTVSLANVGHAEATGLVLTVVLPDGASQQVQVPGAVLARGAVAQVPFTFTLPAGQAAGTVRARASVQWVDAASNAYGPVSASAETEVRRSNLPPAVNAGPDLTLTLPAGTTLQGHITDDGMPGGAALTAAWVQVSGPGTAVFADATQAVTGVTFTEPGTYVLRLIGSDGELSASDEATVVVRPREGSGTTLPGGGTVPGEVLINVVREGNQLRLDNTTSGFSFIWVAVSTKGTVVKINTETGAVLGEYYTSPAGQPRDPSRTTVDKNGSVWATNRAGNSVVHIGLVENGQCVDRNGNGVIDTSKGFNDLKAWTNAGNADTNGGVTTAQDECLLHYVRVRSSGTRHVSVTEDNDIWVSGTGGAHFDLVDGATGVIKRQESSVGYGGYGGLIDRNGVIWSSNYLLRWDTALPLNGPNGVNWRGYSHASYGLCLGPDGHVWNTEYGPRIRRFAPDGTLLATYNHGGSWAQGCVVDRNGHVWVAHSLNGNTVGHLKPDGSHVGNILVGSGPTGVAVDGAGKVWATNYYSGTVTRIDPTKGPLGPDGVTRVGQADFTSPYLGGNPYNYSDMTGSTLTGSPDNGTWTVVRDSGQAGSEWGKVTWNGQVCGDASLTVTVASSEDGVAFSPPVPVRSGQDFDVPNGRYLRVNVAFKRSSKGESPVLYDLAIGTAPYVMPAQANGAPTVEAGRDRTLTHPNPLRLTGSACDDGLPSGASLALTWSQVDGPGTANFSAPGREATDVSFSVPGTYVLRLTASDSALSGHDDVTVTVLPRNQPPAVQAEAPVAVDLPEVAQLSGTAADDGLPAGGAVTVAWSKVSGPGNVTFSAAGSLQTAAAFSLAGTYVLRLTASDSHLSASADVTVVANPAPPVNQPPVVSAGSNQSVAVGAVATLRGTVTDDNLPTPASLSVTWTQVSGPGTVGFGNFRAATTTASFSAAGVYVLRLTATDTVLSSSSDVSVAVGQPAPANQPPAVAAGANQAITLPETATLAGTVTDDGLPGGALTVQWSRVSGPGTVSFTAADQPATVAAFGTPGTYVLRLSASDSQFTSASDVTVVVSAPVPSNRAPVVDAGPSWNLRLPTRTVTLAGTVTDDGLPLGAAVTQQWSMVDGPAAVVFSAPTQKTTTVTVSRAGTYRLRLTASDTKLTGASELTLNVSEASADNAPPAINPGPNLTVNLPAPAVALNGAVTDDGRPAGSALETRWELASGPAPVAFADAMQPATTAAFTTVGDYLLRLVASDGEWVASAVKQVRVQPVVVNQRPTVAASGPATVTLPGTALLSGTVRDDGLPASQTLTVAWSQVSGPGTVAFTRPAQVSTAAAFSVPGDYVLRLTAHDGELTASADVTVRALVVNQAPTVFAGDNQVLAFPQRTVTLRGTATDDGLPAGGALTVAWSVVGGAGTVAFGSPDQPVTTATFSYPGSYLLRLTATDSEKTSSSDMVVDVGAEQGPLPTVSISSPVDGTAVSGPVTIAGTVSGGEWKVEYAPGGIDEAEPRTWTTVASGTTPVSGTLATFDPTVLLNGVYTVRLAALTESGQSVASITTVAEKGRKVGYFSLSFVDLNVPVGGLPIEVSRTYDSRDKRVGDFGTGWSMGVRNVRIEKSVNLGRHWTQTKSSGFFPSYCLVPSRPAYVTITFLDGKVYKFRAKSASGCQVLYPLQTMDLGFEPEPGTRGSLVSHDGAGLFVLPQGGIPGPVLLTGFDLEPVEFNSFQLTTEDGTVYQLDQRRGVTSVSDANGNTVFIERNGIIHSSGRSVTFERDALGRITRMTDPNGATLSYAYDARGDLVRVTDREGAPTSFTYDDAHLLEDIIDSRGVRAVRNDYDASGRLVSTTDAAGKTLTYAHDLSNNREIITDRLGHTTIYEYDGNGNVTRLTDALGNVTRYTYDSRDNRLSETNALGQTTLFTYDAQGNRLSETDALGNVTRYTYNAAGKPLTVTDPLGRVVTNVYDTKGNLASVTDALGNRTAYTYNTRGWLSSQTDPSGGVTSFEYDGSGRLTRRTDALGATTALTYDGSGNVLTETVTRVTPQGTEQLVTRHEYDRRGNRTATVHPDGTRSTTVHDVGGRAVESTNGLGLTTRYAYDDLGRMVRTHHPDGTSESTEYDANGNRIATTDRAGRTTRMTYDAVGRLLTTTYPDGTSRSNAYDAAGRLASTTDELGQVTRYGYDAAGRQSEVTDALGNVSRFEYDAASNQVAFTDAKGNTTRFEYDALDRQTKVLYPDGTSTSAEYDARGNTVAATDAAGRVTRFAYDLAGRLTHVTDALGGITAYAYDSAGNRISQTDANGRDTRFEYDTMGRLVRRILPLGQVEQFTYDAAGNPVSKRDFNGRLTTYAYDTAQRLIRKTPDTTLGAPPVSFTYTATGRLASMTDAQGTTVYTYDERDRVTSKVTPAGTLFYAYDRAGNRRTLRSDHPQGVSLDYAYDALNRLAQVTDLRGVGEPATYQYDAVGNLAGYIQPNGVQTQLSYDALNRLQRLEVTGSQGTLARYTYTLGATGHRQSVAELSGRNVTWSYDALYRLTEESILGARAANGTVTYQHDAVGNRLSRTSTLAGVATTTSTYDANDRLLSDTHDANGNTVLSGGNTYGYDAEDRLTRLNGTQVVVAYDGLGNRVSKTVDGVTTHYLVDDADSQPTGYAQVVEERVDGQVQRVFTHGHHLISQRYRGATGWEYRYYGHDGTGSVRLLTDTTGAVTDTYEYDAFGNVLDQSGTSPNDYLFMGERLDKDLGLIYLRARYVSASTGRFWTMDTFQGVLDEPLSLHKYLYANADPLNGRDPSGYFTISSSFTSMAISSVLTTLAISIPLRALEAAKNLSEGMSLGAVAQEAILGIATDAALAVVFAGALHYVPKLIQLRSVGQAVTRAANSVWNMNKFARGRAIEAMVMGRTPTLARVSNFPVIDDFLNGIATSIKSLDATLPSYQQAGAIASRLGSYARKLSAFNGASKGGITVAQQDIQQRVLLVAFEDGALTAAQAAEIRQFAQAAQTQWPNIQVVFQFIR